MSIEKSLERIATALEALAASKSEAPAVPVPAAAPVPQPVPTPVSTAAPQPVPAAPVPSAPVAPVPAVLPFNDAATLIKYVTEAYGVLGPEKGMQIQAILEGLGHTNVTDVPAEKYGQLHSQIEALKAA